MAYTKAKPKNKNSIETQNLILAIDVSKSMDCDDVPLGRLNQSKQLALDLASNGNYDKVAIIAFAGKAGLICPLTTDFLNAQNLIIALETKAIDVSGTNIIDGLSMGLNMAHLNQNAITHLFLLTDGENLIGKNHQFEKINLPSQLFIIGFGTQNGKALFSKGKPVTDSLNQAIVSKLDKDFLIQIARESNGQYHDYTGFNMSLLPKIELEATKIDDKSHLNEYANWILLLVYSILLSLESLPFILKRGTKNVLLVALILVSPILYSCQNDSAKLQNLLESKQYKKAYAVAIKLYQQQPNEAKIAYNCGNICYRLNDYTQAIDWYKKAQSQAPKNRDLIFKSSFNIANAFYKLEQCDSALHFHLKCKTIAPFDISVTNNLHYDSLCINKNKVQNNARFNQDQEDILQALNQQERKFIQSQNAIHNSSSKMDW